MIYIVVSLGSSINHGSESEVMEGTEVNVLDSHFGGTINHVHQMGVLLTTTNIRCRRPLHEIWLFFLWFGRRSLLFLC
mgnify:CR=1 FL=1